MSVMTAGTQWMASCVPGLAQKLITFCFNKLGSGVSKLLDMPTKAIGRIFWVTM